MAALNNLRVNQSVKTKVLKRIELRVHVKASKKLKANLFQVLAI
jgi:hypothetical protein